MLQFLKNKTFLLNLSITILFGFGIGVLIYIYTSMVLVRNTEDALMEIAKQGAKTVEKEIHGYFDVLESLATMDRIKDPANYTASKLAILQTEAVRSHHSRMCLIDILGNGYSTDGLMVYLGDQEYFHKAMAGICNVSLPTNGGFDKNTDVIFAAPIYYQGKIISVLSATHSLNLLKQITDEIKAGSNGAAFIINKDGKKVININQSSAKQEADPQSLQISDRLTLRRLLRQMKSGQAQAMEYNYHNAKRYLGFAPIRETDWFLAVSAPNRQILGGVNRILVIFELLVFAVFLSVVVFYIYNHYLRRQLLKESLTSKNAINTANIIMIHFTEECRIVVFNQYAEAKLGYGAAEIIGHIHIGVLIPEEYGENFLKLLDSLGQNQVMNNFELPLLRRDGQMIHILWNITKINDELDHCPVVEMMGIDISQRVHSEKELLANHEELTALYEQLTSSTQELRRQYQELSATQNKLSASEERFRLAQEGSNDVIWDWDVLHKEIFFSTKFTSLTGYTMEEITTIQKFGAIVHPEDCDRLRESQLAHFHGTSPEFSAEFRIRQKNGAYKWVFARGMAIKGKHGQVTRMAGSLTDIDLRKANELRIYQLAYFDPLTGLPNRTWLYENAPSRLLRSVNSGKKGILALIDIDNFKSINDTFGHVYGDKLLLEVGNRISAKVGEGQIVSRLSGDKFIILIEGRTQEGKLVDYAEMIMGIFNAPFEIDGHKFYISASAGITTYPDCGAGIAELLKNADLAMYHAKAKGKRTFVFYNQSMNDELVEKTRLGNSLRQAIANQEFSLYYQPQVNVATGKISGFESLIRWNSPDYGPVPPAKFITLAEENGLIVPIGLWVLQQSVLFASRLYGQGFNGYISVNLSIVQLLQNDFTEKVREIIEQVGLPPQFLKLEITESLLMESLDENIEKLRILKQRGIGIFLDDFGTGYSSLNYLRKLPIDAVKIDKSFIKDLPAGDTEQKLIISIISLAHLLGLKVIAEGVETSEQYDYLASNKCDAVQGYLLGKPMPEREALALLREQGGRQD